MPVELPANIVPACNPFSCAVVPTNAPVSVPPVKFNLLLFKFVISVSLEVIFVVFAVTEDCNANVPVVVGKVNVALLFDIVEIIGAVSKKQLQLTFVYSRQIYRRQTIEKLGQKVVNNLEAFIVHSQSSKTAAYTPSDFSKANLNQKQLDKFLGKLKK